MSNEAPPPPTPQRDGEGNGNGNRFGSDQGWPRWTIWAVLGVIAAVLFLPALLDNSESTPISYGDFLSKLRAEEVESGSYDNTNQRITGTLNDYAVPRADLFPEFETHHTETPTYINPMGVKGIGEAATIGATPCIVNAVVDALWRAGAGERALTLQMPATPERVLWGVEQMRKLKQTAATSVTTETTPA